MSSEEAEKYSLWKNSDCLTIQKIVMNYKKWEDERENTLREFCRSVSTGLLRNPSVDLVLAGEDLQTLEGSGCAIINTLRACGEEECNTTATLALLAAGEGSRLWGISASNGFVKSLTALFSSTLLEQTIDQCGFILSQAPSEGKGMTIIAGTDNILLPSCPLQTIDGRMFSEVKEGNLFFFSKEIPVLDPNGVILSTEVMNSLEQLGVLLVDPKTSIPVEFMEKVKSEEILRLLHANGKSSVFFNAFIFGCTPLARKMLVKLYSQAGSDGTALYTTKGFDWSSHVLEPLAILVSSKSLEGKRNNWNQRWTAKQKKLFSNQEDWTTLFNCAVSFQNVCGSPVTILIGENAEWYDTGMCKDLYELYRRTVQGTEEKKAVIRKLLSLPPRESIIDCKSSDKIVVHTDSLVLHSQFKKGGSVGKHSVVVNCIFEEYVTIPEGCVMVNSHVKKIQFKGEINQVLVYASFSPSLCIEYNEAVYFSYQTKEKEYKSGVFPLRVLPKISCDKPYFGHYNVAHHGVLLSQPIFPTSTSFRDLQAQRIPILSLSYLELANKH